MQSSNLREVIFPTWRNNPLPLTAEVNKSVLQCEYVEEDMVATQWREQQEYDMDQSEERLAKALDCFIEAFDYGC